MSLYSSSFPVDFVDLIFFKNREDMIERRYPLLVNKLVL